MYGVVVGSASVPWRVLSAGTHRALQVLSGRKLVYNREHHYLHCELLAREASGDRRSAGERMSQTSLWSLISHFLSLGLLTHGRDGPIQTHP